MINDRMTSRQLTILMIMFLLGNTIIIGTNSINQQDSWISFLLAAILSVPLVLMYARINHLNPGEDIFDICEKLLGKVIGKIISILMIFYFIHLSTLVLSSFVKYVELTTLLNTPEILVAILFLSISVYIARSRVTTLGKWAIISFIVVMAIMVITIIFSFGRIDTSNLLPIMNHPINKILLGASSDFAFPFAEIVVFLGTSNLVKKNTNFYKVYIYAIISSTIIFLLVFLRNLTVLGVNFLSDTYFPSYITVRILEIGNVLTRIEGAITINFILAGITKITICLMAAAKGVCRTIKAKNDKDLVIAVALIILAISTILYKNVNELYDFGEIYVIYAFPFQVIIPFIIWIASEIKNKKISK